MLYRVHLVNIDNIPVYEGVSLDDAKESCVKAGFECRIHMYDKCKIEEGFITWSPLRGFSATTWNYL